MLLSTAVKYADKFSSTDQKAYIRVTKLFLDFEGIWPYNCLHLNKDKKIQFARSTKAFRSQRSIKINGRKVFKRFCGFSWYVNDRSHYHFWTPYLQVEDNIDCCTCKISKD